MVVVGAGAGAGATGAGGETNRVMAGIDGVGGRMTGTDVDVTPGGLITETPVGMDGPDGRMTVVPPRGGAPRYVIFRL